MKIMVYEGPKQITLQEVSDVAPVGNQVKIETMFSGISHGTEMAVYADGKAVI